mgnify:CR=1 FL=1
MRIVDTSVLLPAVSPSLRHHEAARTALEAAINGDRAVGLCWVVVNAFLRLTTKPGLFATPYTIDEAWEMVDAWLDHANVRVVQETEEHARLWSELLRSAGTGGCRPSSGGKKRGQATFLPSIPTLRSYVFRARW